MGTKGDPPLAQGAGKALGGQALQQVKPLTGERKQT